MTDDDLRQRRDAAYTECATQLHLRGCLLAEAAATGLPPDKPLPPALRAVHAAYTARITELNVVIADLDRRIATKEEHK